EVAVQRLEPARREALSVAPPLKKYVPRVVLLGLDFDGPYGLVVGVHQHVASRLLQFLCESPLGRADVPPLKASGLDERAQYVPAHRLDFLRFVERDAHRTNPRVMNTSRNRASFSPK